VKRFTVVDTDTGTDVWTGEATDPIDAAERATRAGGMHVERFFATSAADTGLRHLTVSVYDAERHAQGDPLDPDDCGFIGTYAARYVG